MVHGFSLAGSAAKGIHDKNTKNTKKTRVSLVYFVFLWFFELSDLGDCRSVTGIAGVLEQIQNAGHLQDVAHLRSHVGSEMHEDTAADCRPSKMH